MRLAAAGWDTHLLTVFTATVPDPQGFALRCQTDKGLGPDVDYMALRRAEDQASARIIGVDNSAYWPFPEAPHRGYESPAELFGEMHPEDEIWRPLAADLMALTAQQEPDAVFGPQGLGNHVDHRQVILAMREAGLFASAIWYRDTPYAIREPFAAPSSLLPDSLVDTAIDIGDVLDRKIAGCCAYASQIGFQFGGEAEVRRKLTQFHQAEAGPAQREGYAERLLVPAGKMLLREDAVSG